MSALLCGIVVLAAAALVMLGLAICVGRVIAAGTRHLEGEEDYPVVWR